jgi:hypothetical protein
LPFQTISAALSASGIVAGDVFFVYPGNYTITTGITLPTGTSLIGISRETSVLTLTTTSNATMITTNANCSIKNISLSIASTTINVSITGVGINAYPLFIDNVAINVNNSLAPTGTSNAIGINSAGTYSPGNDYTYTIRNSFINYCK